MISIEQINGEIAVLEEEKPTHVIMQKLAALYVVRDHITLDSTPAKPETIPTVSNSDFAQVISGMSARDVYLVMDELMDSVRVLQPRLYDAVMRKLKER